MRGGEDARSVGVGEQPEGVEGRVLEENSTHADQIAHPIELRLLQCLQQRRCRHLEPLPLLLCARVPTRPRGVGGPSKLRPRCKLEPVCPSILQVKLQEQVRRRVAAYSTHHPSLVAVSQSHVVLPELCVKLCQAHLHARKGGDIGDVDALGLLEAVRSHVHKQQLLSLREGVEGLLSHAVVPLQLPERGYERRKLRVLVLKAPRLLDELVQAGKGEVRLALVHVKLDLPQRHVAREHLLVERSHLLHSHTAHLPRERVPPLRKEEPHDRRTALEPDVSVSVLSRVACLFPMLLWRRIRHLCLAADTQDPHQLLALGKGIAEKPPALKDVCADHVALCNHRQCKARVMPSLGRRCHPRRSCLWPALLPLGLRIRLNNPCFEDLVP
mmetsp:Transcript_26633/g.65624  ORF Transcript_26633/g.65624 Transcript_26633/m.65624 type:complete len:385 (-) Transcript_26633:1153-2307(-)